MRLWAALAAAVCAVAAAGASPASSAVATPPIVDPAYATNLKSFVKATNGSYHGHATEVAVNSTSTSSARAVQSTLWRGRVAAGVLPALRLAGPLAIGSTAFTLGWKIGRTIDTKYLHISAFFGETYTAGTSMDGLRWFPRAAGTCVMDYCSPVDWWVLQGHITGGTWTERQRVECSPACTGFYTEFGAEQGESGATIVDAGLWNPSFPTQGRVKLAVRTDTAVQQSVRVNTFKDWGSEPTGVTTAHGLTSGTITDTQLDAFRTEAGGHDGTAGFVNHVLNPGGYPDNPTTQLTMPDCEGLTATECADLLEADGWLGTATVVELGREGAVMTQPAHAVITTSPGASTTITTSTPVTITRNPNPMPIEVLRPTVNETYAAYVARLQASGYVGTATSSALTEDLSVPWQGGGSPVRIQTPYITTQLVPVDAPTSAPAPWPNPPRIDPDDPVTVFTNAPAMPPAETGGSSSCEPWLQVDPDLSPITDVAYGEHFPFGVFAYIEEFVGQFDVSPTAPSVTFQTPAIAVAGNTLYAGNDSYTISLSYFNDHMAVVRGIIAVALIVGTVWYVGATMLGFRAAGNPAEAADDGVAW